MSLESGEIAVGATGNVWRGTVGTPFPTNISADVDETLWTDLGFCSEEGVRFKFNRETTELGAWQSFDPVRILTSKIPKEIAHDFLQWNQNTWATAMGGGTWSGSAPNYVYTPPPPEELDQFAEIVELRDGDEVIRLCYYKVQNMSGVEFAATRDNAMILPVTVKVLAADGTNPPFIMQTNIADLGDATMAGS